MSFKSGDNLISRGEGVKVTYCYPVTGSVFMATNGYMYNVHDFTKANKAIVALIENGTPKPATRPYVHDSRDGAEQEARRLAALHAGSEFAVFELVSRSHAPKPIATTKAA